MANLEICDGAAIMDLQKQMTSIQGKLVSAYQKTDTLFGEVKNGVWSGASKDTFFSYMDLLLKYHGSFIGETGDKNPSQEAVDALNTLISNLSSFYETCTELQDLEKM